MALENKGDTYIRDEEKARRMAEAEDPKRIFLAEFKKYNADPVAYSNAEAPGPDRYTDAFIQLARMGITTRDLEVIVDEAGEEEGKVYDYEQKLKGMNPPRFAIERGLAGLYTKIARKTFETVVKRAGQKARFFLDSEPYLVERELGQGRALGDSELQECNKLFHIWQVCVRREGQVEKEFADRKAERGV